MKVIKIFSMLLISAVLLSSCTDPESEETLWARTKKLQAQEKHDETIKTLEDMLDSYPEGKFASIGRFTLADAYANIRKDFPEAITEYRRVIISFPETPLAPKAQFMIGYIYANYLKDYDKARVAYMEFQKNYSDNDLSQAVKFELQYLGKNLDEIVELKEITKPDAN